MGLAGTGAVAIWHDIAPEGRAQFYAWHGQEHMPERVAIPGFLRGRRYAALAGAPEFFNLYETVSPQVLTGPDYLARLNDPTPWTAATVVHFRNVARSLCRVEASHGHGQGGLIATFRYGVDARAEDEHRRSMAEERLPAIAANADVAGCHLLVADPEASAVVTAEQRTRGGARNVVPRWIVLVEGWGDVDPFRALCDALLADGTFAPATAPPDLAIYRLQNDRQPRPAALP